MLFYISFMLFFLITAYNVVPYINAVNKYSIIQDKTRETKIVNKDVEKMFNLNIEIKNKKEIIQIYSLLALISIYLY